MDAVNKDIFKVATNYTVYVTYLILKFLPFSCMKFSCIKVLRCLQPLMVCHSHSGTIKMVDRISDDYDVNVCCWSDDLLQNLKLILCPLIIILACTCIMYKKKKFYIILNRNAWCNLALLFVKSDLSVIYKKR